MRYGTPGDSEDEGKGSLPAEARLQAVYSNGRAGSGGEGTHSSPSTNGKPTQPRPRRWLQQMRRGSDSSDGRSSSSRGVFGGVESSPVEKLLQELQANVQGAVQVRLCGCLLCVLACVNAFVCLCFDGLRECSHSHMFTQRSTGCDVTRDAQGHTGSMHTCVHPLADPFVGT